MRWLLLSLFVSFLVACERTSDNTLSGSLYFPAGNYLGRYELADGSSEIVVGMGEANVRYVGANKGTRLLLVLETTADQQDGWRIVWLDTKTHQITTLFQGLAAVFLPVIESYVYDDGTRLSIVSFDPDYVADGELYPHRLNAVRDIVAVSDRSVVFEDRSDSSDGGIFHYDAGRRSLRRLANLSQRCSLRAALWIAEHEALLCREAVQDSVYRLIDLEGRVVQQLVWPADRAFAALAWLPDVSRVLVSETRHSRWGGRSRSILWSYELATGELSKLSSNQQLGGSVVYRRQ